MCEGCYDDRGRPKIVNEKTLAAIRLIHRVYQFDPIGGALHVVLDDWNIGDSSIAYCSDGLEEDGRNFGESGRQIITERQCADLLMTMTEEERASALAMEHGFFMEDVMSAIPP